MQVSKGRTTLIIAHRLSTVVDAGKEQFILPVLMINQRRDHRTQEGGDFGEGYSQATIGSKGRVRIHVGNAGTGRCRERTTKAVKTKGCCL
jgi:hypothetical protein